MTHAKNTSNPKILVVGATGKVGSELIQILAAAGENVKAATRNTDQDLGKNIEAVFFDYDDESCFGPALEDVDRLFYLSRPADDQAVSIAKAFFKKADQMGVKHIVNMSALGVDADDNIPLRQVEMLLEKSDRSFTLLRPNWFMQNFTTGNFGPMIREQAALYLPAANAGVSFIDVADIAAVAAVALTQEGHRGKTYNLTGGETLTHTEIAAQISAASGREVSYHAISTDDFAQALASQQTPKPVIAFMQMLFGAMREGYNAPVISDTSTVLDRAPGSFAAFASEVGTGFNA